MSVLDRVHRRETEDRIGGQTSPETSNSLTLADPPVIRRLKIVLGQLSAFVTANRNSKYSRFAWVLDSMMEEVLSEIADNGDTETMGHWFVDFGKVVEWCGSGDDSVLPESVRQYLSENHPAELKAIEGPKVAVDI